MSAYVQACQSVSQSINRLRVVSQVFVVIFLDFPSLSTMNLPISLRAQWNGPLPYFTIFQGFYWTLSVTVELPGLKAPPYITPIKQSLTFPYPSLTIRMLRLYFEEFSTPPSLLIPVLMKNCLPCRGPSWDRFVWGSESATWTLKLTTKNTRYCHSIKHIK